MNNKKVITNFLWRFAERIGAQLVAFIVSIVLARLLEPEIYGTIALVTVFTAILNVFIDSGMGNALIQKKDADDLDFSTVFYFNVTVCVILYLLMFFLAPAIAAFYKIPSLVSIVRVLSLTLIISGVKNIQQAYVSRTMQFKRFFFATLGGTLGAAVIGIIMAFAGMGIWALVAQQLFNALVDTIVLWLTVKWRPKRMFSIKRLKSLLSYGWKLLMSSLLTTVYDNIRQLIIGKMYSSADLAYFNRGKQFPSLIITNVNTSIDSVLLPTMSREQDDVERVKNMTRRAIKTSVYIMAPMMVGLICCAKPLVLLILTAKWIGCVPFMRIMCITCIFYPIHTANLNALKAIGRSDLYLILEILKKISGASILLLTMWHGVYVLAYGLLVESFIAQLINSWPNRKLLSYGYVEQMLDIFPSVALSVFMGVCIYPLSFIRLSSVLILMIQVFSGAAVYIVGSVIFKLESFTYLWTIVSPIFAKVLRHNG